MHEKIYNQFEELKIFENDKINSICDDICSFVRYRLGENLVVCGSLAKVFNKDLPNNYQLKDVDFIIDSLSFQRLTHFLNQIDGVLMIEKQPFRIILYTSERICVEIWRERKEDKNRTEKKFKNKIPYLL